MKEFIEGINEGEEPSKKWTNNESGDKIPKEEAYDTGFGGVAVFPGDFGV